MNIKIISPVIPITLISLSLLTVGCSSSLTTAELPTDGPKMQEVYENHNAQSGAQVIDKSRQAIGTYQGRLVYNGDADLEGYTRTAYTEIDELFPRLPNPTLIMYVDPHLTRDGYPVPGYSTAFTMYKSEQYALPGEAAVR